MTANRIISGPPATDRRFERIVRRTIFCVVTPFLLAGAISSYRAWVQVRNLDLHFDGPLVHAGFSARADVVSSGRVPVTLSLELVQGSRVEMFAMKIVPKSKEPFFDPRMVEGTLSAVLTERMLARFAPGPALIRATARGRPQWLREPPPLIKQVAVVIDSEPTVR